MVYSLKKRNEKKYKATNRKYKETNRKYKATNQKYKTINRKYKTIKRMRKNRRHKKQYGGNFNTEQISDLEEHLKNLEFDDDDIDIMIGLLNRYSSCILQNPETYELLKSKLEEFSQGDYSTERRHQITNKLLTLIMKKCGKKEPETDTEDEDD